jgi:hypothetical protein
MRNPGSAGLTADRLGDADKWVSDEKTRENSTSTLVGDAPVGIAAQEEK